MKKTVKMAFALAVSALFVACGAEKQEWLYQLENVNELGLSNGYIYTIPDVPDGNYTVEVVIGSKEQAGVTSVRGESRRLFLENIPTDKGEFKTFTFNVNKRDTIISEGNVVRIKPREKTKLNWDSNLTLEITGSNPTVEKISVRKADDDVITVFLCGDSTTVDQDTDPWASWGQMLPRFLDEKVSVANYGESGESSNSFIFEKRLEKLMTQIKAGDYIFVVFGHNDEKQTGPEGGAFKHFTKFMQVYIDSAFSVGAHPVLLTPTQRRNFDENGKIVCSHGDFPEAAKQLAAKNNIPIIDLTTMTTAMYEALGVEGSKNALVHYPANTFTDQPRPMADNTHFNMYGAYQVAKCVIQGIRDLNIPLKENIRKDYTATYDPSNPDKFEDFEWTWTTVELTKPDGD